MTILEIEKLAESMIKQWEKYDRFRIVDGEQILFADGEQPDHILISKTLVKSLKIIRMARCQFLGCGGQLKPDEVIQNIHLVIDSFHE
jgi:hypothetical protein